MDQIEHTRDSALLERQAYDAVISWLSRGEVKPGESLPLREMAKRLGMSRTPLRAAVGRLHEQGIVSYNPRFGFSLALPTISDLYELFDLRIMCETHAVRRFFLKFERRVPPEIPLLARDTWQLAGQIVQDPAKYPEFSASDRSLHREIVALGESSRLTDWYGQLNLFSILLRLGWAVPVDEEEFRASAREHLSIVEAMEGADAAETVSRLEAHLLRVRDQMIDRVVRVGSIPIAASQRTGSSGSLSTRLVNTKFTQPPR